jgi:hypothetical protein
VSQGIAAKEFPQSVCPKEFQGISQGISPRNFKEFNIGGTQTLYILKRGDVAGIDA